MKGQAPYAGKMSFLSQARRPSWVGNMDSIALVARENHFMQLYDRSRQEVGAVLSEQTRRMSELSEDWNNSMGQQRNADQGDFHLFLKAKLEQLYKYLSETFGKALQDEMLNKMKKPWDCVVESKQNLTTLVDFYRTKCEKLIN